MPDPQTTAYCPFFPDFQSRLRRIAYILYTDLQHIAASNTASDDVTNWVKHRIFNTDLLYSFAQFIVKNDEKNSP